MPASSTSPVVERAEARLLLRACGSAAAGPAPAAAAVSDWSWLLRAAERHAVVPALQRHLASGVEGSVPPTVLDWLRARADENALRNVLLAQQLAAVLERLDAAGVAAIPLKGPSLALRAYSGLAPRQFHDLDVLVHRADLARARRTLAVAGFAAMAPLESDGADAALVAADCQEAFTGTASGVPGAPGAPGVPVTLELHWALGRGGGLDEAWAWRHARPERVLGRDVMTLAPEAELLYLAVHGAKHGWRQLGWVRDVAALRRAAPGAERAAAPLARAAHAERMLALALLVSSELAGAPDAGSAPRADVAAVARAVRAALFDERTPPLREAVRFQLAVRDRARDRARYLADLFTSPHLADVQALSLPAGLGALYRVARPARLVARRLAHGR